MFIRDNCDNKENVLKQFKCLIHELQEEFYEGEQDLNEAIRETEDALHALHARICHVKESMEILEDLKLWIDIYVAQYDCDVNRLPCRALYDQMVELMGKISAHEKAACELLTGALRELKASKEIQEGADCLLDKYIDCINQTTSSCSTHPKCERKHKDPCSCDCKKHDDHCPCDCKKHK